MCPLPTTNLAATLVLEPYDKESLEKFQLIVDRLLTEKKVFLIGFLRFTKPKKELR